MPRNKWQRVGVKFCGHCAPVMDMMSLLHLLQSSLPGIEFSFYVREQGQDLLLVMHACDAQCALVPEFDGPVIQVSPYRIDNWTYPEDEFVKTLAEKILLATGQTSSHE